MQAAALLARAELRRRWIGVVAIGLLAGLFGGSALALAQAARRTGTAFERLGAATGSPDAVVVANDPALVDSVLDRPEVAASWVARGTVGQPDPSVLGGTVAYFIVVSGATQSASLIRPIIEAGRAADPNAPDEIVVASAFARDTGVDVGDELPMKLLGPDEYRQFDTGFGEPDGHAVRLRVVGRMRISSAIDQVMPMLGTPAFNERYAEGGGPTFVFTRLGNGRNDLPSLSAAIESINRRTAPLPGGSEFAALELQDPEDSGRAIKSTASVLVTGFAIAASLLALVAVVVLAQTVARHHLRNASERRIAAAVGASSGQRAAAAALLGAAAGGLALVVSIITAALASPLAPIGSLRRLEPHPGFAPNIAMLAAGGALIALVLLALWIVAGTRRDRQPDVAQTSVSTLADRLAHAGAAPSTVTGVRFALERGRARAAVGRSSIAAVVLGVAGLTAGITFAGSLDRFVTTPERWGWSADFEVADAQPELIDRMVADRRLDAVAVARNGDVVVNDKSVLGLTFEARRGTLTWTVLEGRMPSSPDEVTLGSRLMADLGVGVGETVAVRQRTGEPRPLRVVGSGLAPVGAFQPMGTYLALTEAGLRRAALSEDVFTQAYGRVAAGHAVEPVTASYAADFEVTSAEPPTDVTNLRELGRLPEAIALLLALVGTAGVLHALVSASRRRRHELGVLRSLGFTRGQAARTMLTMATATVLVGILIGMPVGLVVGSTAWRVLSGAIHVAGDVLLPVMALALAIPAGVALANVAAIIPAVRVARLRPVDSLRAE